MTKQEAIEYLAKEIKLHEIFNETEHRSRAIKALYMAIEAVEQEPKRGKWIKDRKFNTRMKTYVCSNCKHRVWGDREKTPYCPNCGSRMEGNEE